VNTVGFKRSRANFEDVLARSIGGGDQAGLGSQVASVQQMMAQGALLGTGNATDLAINGDGFFQVRGAANGLQGTFYTRAGQFKVDSDGFVVTQSGLRLQGYNADVETGQLVQQVTDLTLPTFELPPQQTENVSLAGNLDAGETTPAAAWDVTDASNTSNYSASVNVFDSLGEAHTVQVYYRREAAGWNWYAVVDGGELSGGTAGTPTQIGTGTLSFDNQGRLTSAGTTPQISADFTGTVQDIALNFGDDIGAGGSGLMGITQYSAPSGTSFIDQDGSSSGSLTGISIGSDGAVTGVFSNGQQRTIGSVLVADFQDAEALERTGGNLFIETTGSGPAVVGEAGTGGRGALTAGSLEQSNVDLAKEFVDLIALQRGFQANSRTITTADQVLQEVMGLKR
jgi:flagellar hook protein FlgE